MHHTNICLLNRLCLGGAGAACSTQWYVCLAGAVLAIVLCCACACLSTVCRDCVMVFITSHGITGACVVGGVLVLLLSSMSISPLPPNLLLILFSALVRQGWCSYVNTTKSPLLTRTLFCSSCI